MGSPGFVGGKRRHFFYLNIEKCNNIKSRFLILTTMTETQPNDEKWDRKDDRENNLTQSPSEPRSLDQIRWDIAQMTVFECGGYNKNERSE